MNMLNKAWKILHILAICVIGAYILCSFGHPIDIDIRNHEWDRTEKEAREKENREAYDRVRENNERGERSSERDIERGAEHVREWA